MTKQSHNIPAMKEIATSAKGRLAMTSFLEEGSPRRDAPHNDTVVKRRFTVLTEGCFAMTTLVTLEERSPLPIRPSAATAKLQK